MPKRLRENTPPTSSDEEEEDMPSKRKRSSSPIILVDRPLADYSDSEEDEEKYYAIKPVRQTESRLFRSKANVYEVDVKKFPEDVSPFAFIPRMFDQLIEDIKKHCKVEGSDKIGMAINHPGLKLGVFITWRDVSSLTGDIITQEIEKVMQSNDKFKINDGQTRLDVTVCRLPTGSGRKPLHHGLFFESEDMCQNKKKYCEDQQYQRFYVYDQSYSGGKM